LEKKGALESADETLLVHTNIALQAASKPEPVPLPSEVNNTCKYPVDDVYVVLELNEEPESRATRSNVLHDDDWHRLIVT